MNRPISMSRKYYLSLFVVAVSVIGGCNAEKPVPAAGQPTAKSADSDDIRPYTPASGAIPNAPVAGGQNLGSGSGGFGVGQAAKDKARSVAGSASSSTLDQTGGE